MQLENGNTPGTQISWARAAHAVNKITIKITMIVSIHSSLADSVACREIGSTLSVIKNPIWRPLSQNSLHYRSWDLVNTVAELDLFYFYLFFYVMKTCQHNLQYLQLLQFQ